MHDDCSSLATSIYVGGIPEIVLRFNISQTLAISGITFFGLGLVFGPIISTGGSEIYGRRLILRFALVLTLVFTIVGGAANNFPTIAVMRLLASTAASPCLAVSVGILNDIWDVQEEKLGTLLIAVMGMCVCWAPELGPLIGTSIVLVEGWRWTFWLTAILFTVCMLLVFPIPETFKPEILRKQAQQLRMLSQGPETVDIRKIFATAVGRPLHMLIHEPIVWSTSLVMMFTQGVVYCFYVAFPLMFQQIYGFSPYHVGLTFLSLWVGSILAIPIVGYFHVRKYEPEKVAAAQENRPIAPEARLYPALVGAVLMPVSLFWYDSPNYSPLRFKSY